MKQGDNLPLRIITGVVAAVYLVAALTFRGWFFHISVIAISLMSLWEANHAINETGRKTSVWAAFVYAGGMVPAYFLGGMPAVIALYALCVLATLFTLVLRGNDDWAVTSVLVYPMIPLTCLLLLPSVITEASVYSVALWLVFAVAFATDTCAYIVGKAIGKHHIEAIRRVSPNKTLEGFIGGIAGGTLICAAVVFIARQAGNLTLGVAEWLPLGLVGALASEVGDLTASAIKRSCGIKDFGRFFPGHGGVLDRLDGVLFNAVWVMAYFVVRGFYF